MIYFRFITSLLFGSRLEIFNLVLSNDAKRSYKYLKVNEEILFHIYYFEEALFFSCKLSVSYC